MMLCKVCLQDRRCHQSKRGPCAGPPEQPQFTAPSTPCPTLSPENSLKMAPKGKSGDKGKSRDAGAEKGGGGKQQQKGAQSINVRHILCEKHAKKEEALAKLNAGSKFDEVRFFLCLVVG